MKNLIRSAFIAFVLAAPHVTFGQQSVAREWNEALLAAIRTDFARPTVHARNLFHTSAAMYEAWAAYDPVAEPYLLGKLTNGYYPQFVDFPMPNDIQAAREEAISYAMYRVLTYRFINSPGQPTTQLIFDDLMDELGYDRSFTSINYESGNPATLGNYIAQVIIQYGAGDHSNEADDYANTYYETINPAMNPEFSGSGTLVDPNRWQPLAFDSFVDQAGNAIPSAIPPFVGAEWGSVYPFSLTNSDRNIYERDDNEYYVFHDPMAPPYLNQEEHTDESKAYQWNFSLVAAWSGHLDPSDGVMWDISPANIGNNPALPETYYDYPEFYDIVNGGDQSRGYTENPKTGEPYEPQFVPRGDYARVLAEFWADGPASETPPGHWFTILNYVSDHPLHTKKFKGEGEILDDLEWDVKAYFVLGGTMHDVAISSWGVKGWYDYIRPISALRYMASKGQSSDPELPNFHIEGVPLLEGQIELIEANDPLAGSDDENVGKIKLYSWKGHTDALKSEDFDPDTDVIGVDWMLAENWWPYQRPSFVTPPFAGYVSGHSTFSRAAAEVMTMLTGDAYFPGGLGEFPAPMNEFLVFEDGPSVDLTLQWATYRDASDQCSLSRIWGGIHPPTDDIPGRKMGIAIGTEAFNLAEAYFNGTVLSADAGIAQTVQLYPNPVNTNRVINISNVKHSDRISILNLQGQAVKSFDTASQENIALDVQELETGIYVLRVNQSSHKFIIR